MVISRKRLEFNGLPLIEKMVIQAPFRKEVQFQNSGCFLYATGSTTTFNAPNQRIQIQSKDAVLLKCGSYFVDWIKQSNDPVVEVYAIHLYPEMLKSIYRYEIPEYFKQKRNPDFIQKIVSNEVISSFIDNLDLYFENPTLVNNDLLELKIKELILLLLQTRNSDSVFELISGLFSHAKVSIQEVIQTHLYSNLSIEKLAEFANMSLSSFKREFKKIYNDSPNHYINTQRLKKAKELLAISDKPISDIAYESGFNDPAYFSRKFKEEFNIAPTLLRYQAGIMQ